MRFLQYINEKYVGSTVGAKSYMFSGGTTEIFVNPSNKEIRDAAWVGNMKGDVRFIADYKHKNLYVFKADTFHVDVSNYLEKEEGISTVDWYNSIWGVANVVGGKLKFDSSDTLGNSNEIVHKDGLKDNWTTKWFTEPLLQSAKSWVNLRTGI